MKVFVKPRIEVPYINFDTSWAVISIASTKEELPKINENEHLVDVLRLVFADSDDPNFIGDSEAFSEKDALEILDFIFDKNIKDVDNLLIHCHAGVSRSPAVAAAIEKMLYNDDHKWFGVKSPNRLVYSTILGVALDNGYWEPSQLKI